MGETLRLRRSEMHMFKRKRFVGCRSRIRFLKMVRIMIRLAGIPTHIMTKTTANLKLINYYPNQQVGLKPIMVCLNFKGHRFGVNKENR